ncbi:hypothetical protein KP509_39G009000 [Ceratopteris richardii]|uniref:Glutaredoxin-dependent peroxiredoxin n=1 Tax=Ceratopteris richardii TaxID=49495 RepID=A0A8T2PYP2_CERRI|nr:hypothetical protein KP509_39G009000 [Ceratopteris richardii]
MPLLRAPSLEAYSHSCLPSSRIGRHLRTKPLRARGVRAAASVGDRLPDASFSFIDSEGDLRSISTSTLTRGKKVVLFAVPGAFTPICTQRHLPSFVQNSYELKRRGVQTIACIAVNDVFVLKAWKESLRIDEESVLVLSDGNAHFTTAMGTIMDLRENMLGLGLRSRRYSLLAEDGVIKLFNLEDGGAFSRSGAENILRYLDNR